MPDLHTLVCPINFSKKKSPKCGSLICLRQYIEQDPKDRQEEQKSTLDSSVDTSA